MGKDFILPPQDHTTPISDALERGDDRLLTIKRAFDLGFGFLRRIYAGTSPSVAVDIAAAKECAEIAKKALEKNDKK